MKKQIKLEDKQYKVQETFFNMLADGSKTIEFKTGKVLNKYPKLALGETIQVEVVSPDFDKEIGKTFFEKECEKCPNLIRKEAPDEFGCIDVEFTCGKADSVINGFYLKTFSYGGLAPRYYSENMTQCKHWNYKGKKLGTMKLELEMVGRFIGLMVSPNAIRLDSFGLLHEFSVCQQVPISRYEYDFLSDTEYFKENDLVVVLKVSEVERYESE